MELGPGAAGGCVKTFLHKEKKDGTRGGEGCVKTFLHKEKDGTRDRLSEKTTAEGLEDDILFLRFELDLGFWNGLD